MMVVKVCVLELQLLCLVPGAVDTKMTDLWSFIPSYNHHSHVSLSDAEFNFGGSEGQNFLSSQQSG